MGIERELFRVVELCASLLLNKLLALLDDRLAVVVLSTAGYFTVVAHSALIRCLAC